MNPTRRKLALPRFPLLWLVPMLWLALLSSCSGDEGTTGDDDDNGGNPTPTPANGIVIAFNLENGQAVSQTVDLQVTGGAATSMAFLAPEELVGVDLNSDPAVLEAQWDTTTDVNGEATITVEADGPGGPVTESITVFRSNISAAIKGVYTSQRDVLSPDYLEDGDYARNGQPLLLSFTASPFGTTPSLARIEIRKISGGGLNLAVPVQGVQDGDWWDFNLGNPTEGTIHMLVSAVNSLGEYSEPLPLDLEVLRNDILSAYVPYDFEVSRDGQTGLLLAGNPAVASQMRLEFLDLSDPTNPLPSVRLLTLEPTVTGDVVSSGNVLVSSASDMAYVVFPNSVSVFAVDVVSQQIVQMAAANGLFAPSTGMGLAHVNRSPYARISPDGRYLIGVVSGALQAIMINTADMSPAEIAKENLPVTGLGPMAIHPTSQYVYFTNSWGDSASGSGTINVFDTQSQAFVDFNTMLQGVQGVTVQRIGDSEYLQGLQPLVTPAGDFLVTTWCAGSSGSGSGETVFTLLSLTTSGASQPTLISSDSMLVTGSGNNVLWGAAVAISPDGKYVLVGDGQPALGGGVVVDMATAWPISAVEFPNGVADGVFLSNTRLLTTSSDWVNRDITIADIAQGTTEELAVPGLTGLQPPASTDEMRDNIIVKNGNYVYYVAPARVAGTTGTVTTLGTSLSVYDIAAGQFVFPNTPTN